jgi:ectoine hydroxylase-related dioxygenase (phytanoyl-CoA dioxygenase family)
MSMATTIESPPATASLKPATALSQDQIDTFWKQGFLRIGSLLNADEIEVLRREYDRIFAEAEAVGGARNLSVGGKTATKGDPPAQRMLQIINLCDRSILFRKLIHDTRILDLVQDLIGPNIMLFHDQALNKPPRTGGPVFWHQDNAYWKCKPATLMSCWMTLDDVDVTNGAMQVVPGSHLSPVWHGSTDTSDALVEAGQIDTSKATVVGLPAGGIMFHHCQTLHYTAPNTTDRQRRAFAIHFMNPGTRDRDGKIIGNDFSHPILRMRV